MTTAALPECPECKGARRLLMASGKTLPCNCACTICGGIGYAGGVCTRCAGSGRDPVCAICTLPLSVEEIAWSARASSPPLCDQCAALSDDHGKRSDTIPAPPPVVDLPAVKPANDQRTRFDPEDYQLAYTAASRALGCDPSDNVLQELATLTRSVRDVMDAVREMRTAEEYDRVTAALRLLRDRRRDDRWRGATFLNGRST